MSVSLELPSELVRYSDGNTSLDLEAATIGEALDRLWRIYPDLRIRVLNQQDQLHSHLMLLHNGRRVGNADFGATPLAGGDKLEIEALASGG